MAYTTGSAFSLKTGYNLPAFIYTANGMMSSTRTSGVVASSDPYTSNATSSFLTDISNMTVTAEQLAFISENEPLLLSIQASPHAPTVTGVSPVSGPLTGRTVMSITGTGFTGATAVTFGGTRATTFTVISNTSITATTPSGSVGTVSVNVTTPDGTSANNSFYTYAPMPTVTGVSPASGPRDGGTSVTITGTGFTGATAVTIGVVAVISFTVTSNTSITATTPPGSGPASINVTTPDGTSANNSFYTYVPIPTVTGVSPASGPRAGGTSVTITGTDFIVGATTVTFNGVQATGITVTDSTHITATTPPGAGNPGVVSVNVTTLGGTSANNWFYTYTTLPIVTVVSNGTQYNPAHGSSTGGTVLSIIGIGFIGATAVTFGDTQATTFTVISNTSITATTPSGSVGTVSVNVTTLGGTSLNNLYYVYD